MCTILLAGKGRTGLIVLANPRTGSMATRDALMTFDGVVRAGGHHEKIERIWERFSKPPHSERLPTAVIAMPTCTTIRNHFDAFASWFQVTLNQTDLKRNPPRFANMTEFIKRFTMPHFGVMGNKLWELHPGTSYVLRYETLQADLSMTLTKCGYMPATLPHKNVTKHKRPYQDYYTKSEVQMMYDRFGEEMTELGYDFN
jgi:hypothetical protein